MGLGQNGVVLSFFEPKRRRFGSAIYLFEIMFIPKRRRFAVVLSKTTSFCYLFKNKKKKETTSFYLLQRQNDVVSPHRLPKNDFPYLSVQFAASGGRGRRIGGVDGGAGRQGRRSLVGIEDLT